MEELKDLLASNPHARCELTNHQVLQLVTDYSAKMLQWYRREKMGWHIDLDAEAATKLFEEFNATL